MSYDRQCVAAVQDVRGEVKRCGRSSMPPADPMYLTLIPVCSWHIMKATHQFAARIEGELETLKRDVAGHECDGERAVQKHLSESLDQHLARTERWRESSRAYFIRCGAYIKIGASQSPTGRAETIRHTGGVLAPYLLDLSGAELIATEPGGFNRERELHAKFSHLRHTGEWFTESPELTQYIESLSEAAA
jgi:hypothetical protein